MVRKHTILGVLATLIAVGLIGLSSTWRTSAAVNMAAAEKESKPVLGESSVLDRMNQRLDIKEIPANTKAHDAIDRLSKQFDVPFIIQVDAFKADLQIQEPENQAVKLPRFRQSRLDTALRLLLPQMQAAYLVRPDFIEITTPQRVRAEVWGNTQDTGALTESNPNQGFGMPGFGIPMGVPIPPAEPLASVTRVRPRMRLINMHINKRALDEALRDLGDQCGVTILLDERRAGDKAKANVHATLRNVPLDTAVRLLANQAELQVILVDNVLFVTTEANARNVQLEQKRANQAGIEDPDAPAPPRGGA